LSEQYARFPAAINIGDAMIRVFGTLPAMRSPF
jgi:hypothetical protein